MTSQTMTKSDIYATVRTAREVAKANAQTHYVYTDGRIAPIVTAKPSPDDRFYRVDADGAVFYCDPRLIADVRAEVGE